MSDPGLTARLDRRLHRDFPDDYDAAVVALASTESGNQDRERVLAAVVFIANRDLEQLRDAVAVSRVDWRDTLLGGGLGNVDWPQRLDAELGSPEARRP